MMPTSAPGARARRGPAGFSLVEVMVVVVIVGLLATAVVLNLPDPRPSLGREAEALAARLVRAREEAVLSHRTLEVVIDPEGHRVRTVTPGGREPVEAPPFEPRAWEETTRVSADVVIGFDPTGGVSPGRVELSRPEAAQGLAVTVDGSGEVRIDAR